MSILTQSGRVAIAESLALRPVHVAWGTGDANWTTPPTEPAGATALLNEIGRRIATEVGYVTPSQTGEITLPNGDRYTRSVNPTNNLLVVCNFDFTDAQSAQIREIGIFVGTQVNTGLPAGQQYFTPSQIANQGRLIHLEYIAPIFRSPAVREYITTVITF